MLFEGEFFFDDRNIFWLKRKFENNVFTSLICRFFVGALVVPSNSQNSVLRWEIHIVTYNKNSGSFRNIDDRLTFNVWNTALWFISGRNASIFRTKIDKREKNVVWKREFLIWETHCCQEQIFETNEFTNLVRQID